jgi:hypothetical protein
MPAEPPSATAAFTLTSFRDGDEGAILDLFARSFHVARSRAHYEWEYGRSPFGNRHVSVARDAGGRIVAHYAGYVVPLVDGSSSFDAHQIGDVMTDQSVRHVGRGPSAILGRTAGHFYDHFCRGRVGFNYGFTTGTHRKFTVRFLSSDIVEPVPYVRRELRGDPLAPLSRLEKRAKGYSLELVDRTGDEWDAFFRRVAPAYGMLVRRGSDWVRWRYLESPDIDYVVVAVRKWGLLAGWSAFRLRGESLLWGDALFDPHWPDAPAILLRHMAAVYPVTRIEAWFPPRPSWFASVLGELRFVSAPEPQDLALMCVPFTIPDATRRMRESLYYTMGDSDLF